ncbi:MAG: glycosyltransferase [candidate division Zixibacteria bacterium]|nr:glycosyltransferase [candidate division Zixibacteria bacterium]
MKVLHLPVNIASQISVTVRALCDIGVDARGISLNNSAIQEARGIETYSTEGSNKLSPRGIINRLAISYSAFKQLRWADVIHWHFGGRVMPMNLDLRYLALTNKPRLVEFWGSDIRIPEISSKDNKYWESYYRESAEKAHGTYKRSMETQKRFSKYGFECLLPDKSMMPYIQKDLFPHPFTTHQRILLDDYPIQYPDSHNKRPLIVHTPSHKGAKGTKAVLKAINDLTGKIEFDFKLIHNVPRNEALSIVRNCDIMLDQFVVGYFGLAALEAMAFGKPTLCYIKPNCMSIYPNDLPVINANQDNLTESLEALLRDGQKRHEIGVKSRAYVEKYHDAHELAHQLVDLYEQLLAKTK